MKEKKIQQLLMIKYLTIIGIVLFLFTSCKNNAEKNSNRSEVEIVVNDDSISVGDFVRGVAYLKNSGLEKKDVKILVYLETSHEPRLLEDLSNIDHLEFYVFENLSKDSLNKKYFSNYPENRTAAFGKSFTTKGDKKIKGYIMEYYGFDPIKDSLKANQFKRYYFEKDIYVQ
ncbi:MAG: hypothetical protein R3353_00060 [Salegentibacter mishustinae]|nr:hypothetical protein [Salegentibacter mishustinae]